MAPASIRLTLFEPVVFLRGQSAVGEDARGRRRQIDFDAPPSQLRGLLTLYLPKPSKIKDISILLQGRARTDWPEGIGPNRLDTHEESSIFSQKIVLFSARYSPPNALRCRANSAGMLPDELLGDASNTNRRNSLHNTQVPTPDAYTIPLSNSRNDHDRNSPTLARTIGNVAARAGTAILPPTLVREINASRQTSSSINRSTSSSPMQTPNDSRFLLSRSASLQGESVLDPPPMYNRTSSTNSASSLRTPEESLNSYSAPDTVSTTDWTPSHLDTYTVQASLGGHQHPQSVSAAGPSNRSILHVSGRQEARGQSNSANCAGVRFDPQALNAALQQNTTNVSSTSSSTSSTNPYFPTVRSGFHSEPNSNRPSSDSVRGHVNHQISTTNNKGKGKANGSTSSPGTGPGVRKGIKGLLGNLLKEEEDGNQRGNATAQQSSNSSIFNADDEENAILDYREFRKGTYTFPFSIPLPSNLPPTLHADFGSNTYIVRAHVHRSGSLTSNLITDKEITLVHAPNEDGQDDNEAIIVERNWEDCLRYIVVVTGKSFPVGCDIPIWVKFVPTEKVRIHRIVASLEERTAYFAKGRRIARHEVPRRWNLLKLAPRDSSSKEGILPIVSKVNDDSQVIEMLTPLAQAAAQSSANASDWQGDSALASLMDPFGPWELAMDLPVPTSGTSIINISTNHKKSNIAVRHLVKLAIRVEKVQGNSEERKLYDILIEAPVTINHSHTANAWLSLPDYWSIGQDQREASGIPAETISSSITSNQRENSTANRRQTAPSLVPRRTTSGSNRIETATSSSSPSHSIAPPLQGRVTDNLIQLSQQWLNLSASNDVSTIPSIVTPMTSQEHEEINGLPTYAMIDNARGSVDLPSIYNSETSVK